MQHYLCQPGTDKWFPFYLADSVDLHSPETGKTHSDLTVEYQKAGTAGWETYSKGADDVVEHGNGVYSIKMGAGEFTQEKIHTVQISCSGCADIFFTVEATTLPANARIARAGVLNKRKHDQNTGYKTVYDNDGTTELGQLETVSTDDGKIVTEQPV